MIDTNQLIQKQILMMNLGDCNGLYISYDMVMNSVESFANKPIILCSKNNEPIIASGGRGSPKVLTFHPHIKKVIGAVCDNPNVIIKDDKVYADCFIWDQYYFDDQLHYDNWEMRLNEDKKSFELVSVIIYL